MSPAPPRPSAGVVTSSIASLEEHIVPVIPFGVLQIDSSFFFSGGSARVYKGVLRSEEVAIKILFCMGMSVCMYVCLYVCLPACHTILIPSHLL